VIHENMTLQLRHWTGDFYILADETGRDVCITATVEGAMDEWIAIAEAMKKRQNCSFRRCAAYWRGHYYALRSPRNSTDDEALLFDAEIDQFAESILAQIGSGAGI
jgi:hypothetical protein